MLVQMFDDPAGAELDHHVNKNAVHTNDHQREDQLPLAKDLHQPVKESEHEQHPSTAEEDPRWGPDAFYDRHAKEAHDHPNQEANDTDHDEHAAFLPIRFA